MTKSCRHNSLYNIVCIKKFVAVSLLFNKIDINKIQLEISLFWLSHS